MHKLRKGQGKQSEWKDVTEDVRIFENNLRSCFEEVHGLVGLVQLSVSQMNSIRELA